LVDHKVSPIGGYFELELPYRRNLLHSRLTRFQSARSAFFSLLRAGSPKKVWMPKYICNAMLAPLENVGIELAWYDLTDELEVDPSVRIDPDDWLLYVNYFGVSGKKVERLLQRFKPSQIILDYSQSFFSPPHKQALATIYSPRKFFGVPDGGLLHSQIPIAQPSTTDTSSFDRMEHMLRRLGGTPESGYAAYQKAEDGMVDMEPKRMSRLSERILFSVDFESARKRRLENFQMLRDRLRDDGGGLLTGMAVADVPLCYPYRSKKVLLREHLISKRIFVGVYWSDALNRLGLGQADKLVRNMLPLPIDQRYGVEEMERIIEAVESVR